LNDTRIALAGRLARAAGIAVLCALAAEVTARVEDLAFDGVPLAANPTADSALLYKGADGITRGRPHGRFRHWHLNSFGFRGPEIAQRPPAGVTRVMVLGSSETFGLYEPSDEEFPRQLAARLARQGPFEVVNAGLFGMTVRTMAPFWDAWASTFQPQVVVVYPSPLFYLQDAIVPRPVAPAAPPPQPARPSRPIADLQSRFVARLFDALEMPDVIQRRRDERRIAALTADRPPGWEFTSSPQDRVRLFEMDLDRLVSTVQQSGATVVLVTHAFRCQSPPTAADLDLLHRTRVFSPRTTAMAIHEFHGDVNRAIVRVAQARNVGLVDADAALSGRPQYFGDLIHFNGTGASVMADTLASYLLSALPGRSTSSRPLRTDIVGHAVQ
jgi:hypothetical protein